MEGKQAQGLSIPEQDWSNKEITRRKFLELAAFAAMASTSVTFPKNAYGEETAENKENISENEHTIVRFSGIIDYQMELDWNVDPGMTGTKKDDVLHTTVTSGLKPAFPVPGVESGDGPYSEEDFNLRIKISAMEFGEEYGQAYLERKNKLNALLDCESGTYLENYFGGLGARPYFYSIEKIDSSRVSADNYILKLYYEPVISTKSRETEYESKMVMFDDQKKIVTEVELDTYNRSGVTAGESTTADLVGDYADNLYKKLLKTFDYCDGSKALELEPKIGHYLYQPEYVDCAPVDLEFEWPVEFKWLKEHPDKSRKIGVTLSAAAYKDEAEGILSELGLQDIEHWTESNCKYFSGDATSTFTLAHQKLDDGNELICVAIRGTKGELWPLTGEWFDNIIGGLSSASTGDYHHGFSGAAIGIDKQLQDYISSLKAKGINENKLCFYFTGHSRGAAVANILAEQYENMSAGKMVSDTFATPNTSWKVRPNKNSNIRNYVNADDIVPLVPFFGSKAGITYGFGPNPNQVKSFYGIDKLMDSNIVNNHMPEDLVAKVYGQSFPDIKWSGTKWIELGLHCPVDVEIYDDKNNLIASSTGSTEKDDSYFDTSKEVLAIEYDDEKMFYLPSDKIYTVKIKGTANGEMTYRVLQSNGSEDATVLIEQSGNQAVQITDGEEQSVVVGEKFEPLVIDEDQAETIKEEFKIIPQEHIAAGIIGTAAGIGVLAATRHYMRKKKSGSDKDTE